GQRWVLEGGIMLRCRSTTWITATCGRFADFGCVTVCYNVKTAADRFSRAVRSIDQECRDNRHIARSERQQQLNEKLRGHSAYDGVTGNSGALTRFLWEVQRRWRKGLYRRSRTRSMNWARFRRLLQRYPLAGVRTVRSAYRHTANP